MKQLLLLAKMTAGLLCVLAIGCERTVTGAAPADDGTIYFASPSVAVEQIRVMLREKNWPELAKYYDLAGSPEDRVDLVSGKFFYTEEKPEGAHPGGFWKYKHPFAPAFEFKATRELEEAGVVEVTVGVEIDQGGGMVQRGMETFLMRRSNRGYQILPHKAPAG